MSDENQGSDTAIGIMDALLTVMEVLLRLGVDQSVFEEALQAQLDGHRAAGRPGSAAVLDYFLEFLADEDRVQHRKMHQLLLSARPKGSA